MGGVKNVMVEYAELKGISFDEAMNSGVTLTQMQAALATNGTNNVLSLPVGAGKAARPPIPWVTLKSYCEVALKTTNLTGWAVAVIENNGLAITWEHCLIEVSVLYSSLSRQLPPLFQIKLFKTHETHEIPLAVEFKRNNTDFACTCANFLSSVAMRRAIDAMELEWAAESAAIDTAAEDAFLDYGQSLAEEQAQLGDEEPEGL